jgi:hypothetical protein
MKKKEGFLAKLLTMHGPEKEDFLHEVPLTHAVETDPEINNMRGLGVSDLASAIISGRKPRLSIELSRHVLEALVGFKISFDSGRPYKMTTTCERPAPVPAGLECWKID